MYEGRECMDVVCVDIVACIYNIYVPVLRVSFTPNGMVAK